MLKCSLCNVEKNESEFSDCRLYPKRNYKHVWCKPCKKAYHKKYSQEWEKQNREKRNARRTTKEWHEYMALYRKEKNLSAKYREYHQKRYRDKRDQMRKKMDEWRANNLDKWNGYGRKRRATMRGLKHEPYLGQEIFDRDKGVCGLCKEIININLKFPNPKSFSVDHILPIYAGGHDTPDNVQASHLGCNARKAAHGYVQK